MAERIQVPPTLMGDTQRQMTQIWNYLYRMSEILNRNLENIGADGQSEQAEAAQGQAWAQLNTKISEMEQKIRNLNNNVMEAYTDETNLNNVTDQGTYWLNISTMTNKPTDFTTSRDYLLQVMTDGEIVKQIIWGRNDLYYREYYNGSWQAWRELTSSAAE